MVFATVVASGCSGAAPASGFAKTHKGDGGTAGATDPGTFKDNKPNGPPPPQTVCAPNPANFEVPGNNCDDDADGTVDNAAACDTGLPMTGDASAFAKAIGLCQTASGEADTKWGVVSATDTGSGVDPSSVTVTLDGRKATAHGASTPIRTTRGRHKLVVSASDYQEAKNMENVPRILPNTATLRATLVVK